MDPNSIVAWNRIRIPIADPDPGGKTRAKMKGKTQLKDRYLGIKSIKINLIGTLSLLL
jgi:hypothetical protein